MRSRIYLAACAAALAAALPAGVRAQHVPLKGTIVSASTTVGPSNTANIAKTPASGNFILTQFCAGGAMTLSGSTFGFIAAVVSGPGAPNCVTFNRGFALPPNETIRCQNINVVGSNLGCSISAVVE